MPTGYTAGIEEGKITSGAEFLMLCARGFGACIDMRDEPLSKPIPDKFQPNGYYAESLLRAQRKLAEYKAMTPTEIHEQNEAEYQKRVEQEKARQKKYEEMFARYQSVRDEVERWVPPTADHDGLKKFALEQIDMCMPDFRPRQENIERISDDEWITQRIDMYSRDIPYYEERIEEERKNYESKNKWIRDLRKSLNIK